MPCAKLHRRLEIGSSARLAGAAPAQQPGVALDRVAYRGRDDADSRRAPEILVHDEPEPTRRRRLVGPQPPEVSALIAQIARQIGDPETVGGGAHLDRVIVGSNRNPRALDRLTHERRSHQWRRAHEANQIVTAESAVTFRRARFREVLRRGVLREPDLAELAALAEGLPSRLPGSPACAIGAPPMDHPNAIRVRELFAAFATGDVDTIRAVIPEHAVWHFPGRRGQLAGTHRGRDAIFAFLLRVRALTGGRFHLELIDVVGNDVHVVALFRGRAERDGRALDNPTA